MAERLSRDERYAALVYVACENDFDDRQEPELLLARFKTIADRFGGHVIVILETYLEYNSRDVLLEEGWSDESLSWTDHVRAAAAKASADLGFRFGDWSDVVDDDRRSKRTIFAPFALYADHSHLSPAGLRLLAGQIHALLTAASSEPAI